MDAQFDRYGETYAELVDRSVAFSGRGHDFFLRAKAEVLLDLVRRRLGDPGELRALDVGCGDGGFDAHLRSFGALEGVDVSERMLEQARARNPTVGYGLADGARLPAPDGAFDVAFASCVLHHVSKDERPVFAAELRRMTRPGGLTVVFEHNPLNPLTRLAVARCEFDDDAVLLGRREVERLLAGVVEARYILFFPWRAAATVAAERALRRVPLGAQYYVAAG